MVDQGIITGPSLREHVEKDAMYTPGYLAPWKFKHWFNDKAIKQDNLKLPFASAKYGAKPKDPNEWAFDNSSAPIATARDSLEYASALFRTKGPSEQDVGKPGYKAGTK
jgi:hypothetical protein